MRYNWDEKKAAKVVREHKVNFEKIVDIFRDPYALEYIDETHSNEDELRFVIIGLTAEYGLVYLVFSEDDPNSVRFITARKAEKWMTKEYEEKRSRI